jgi:thiol-disulfide isomerase/thioredoxin
MLKLFTTILLITTLVSCSASKKSIKSEDKMVIGTIDKSILEELPYKNWFTPKYERVAFDEEIILKIKKHIKDIKIKAFIGVWCGDSKLELPVFYKLLNEVDFDEGNLEMVAVNRKKNAKGLTKGYNIIKVPTFIFYKDNKELGRFVEYPMESLEEDILKIISGKAYKHFYED